MSKEKFYIHSLYLIRKIGPVFVSNGSEYKDPDHYVKWPLSNPTTLDKAGPAALENAKSEGENV